jgi:alpha-ribazole phosphatase
MILWTLRHTKPYNPDNLCYGRADFDVSSTFEKEYPPALDILERESRPERIFASPLLRCVRLADKVSERLGLPYGTDPAIIELNFGSWERHRLDLVPRNEMAAWLADLRGFRFPDGESFHDMDVRVKAFLAECIGKNFREILWVTHAGVIATLEHSVCGVPEDDFVEGRFPYAMVTRFDIQEKGGKLTGTFETKYGGLTQPPLDLAAKALGK